MTKPKLKIVKRSVKHVFTPPETADLNIQFGQSFDSLQAAEADLKSITTQYKAKVQESESRMTSLRATINAGFEMRDKNLVVVMDFKAGKKFFFLETLADDAWLKQYPNELDWPREFAVITEAITDADRQQELIEAEGKFEAREEIALFATAGEDSGVLTVGRLGGKWFSALRIKIGTRVISERLDKEQACSKKRPDQIKRALKRFSEWLDENLGREEAKGFQNAIELVKVEHAEREE